MNPKYNSIVLIGMPGSGKSTIGKRLAEELDYIFIDGDELIEKKIGDRQDFLEQFGNKAYLELEEEVFEHINLENSVISPGGSIIFCNNLMKRFQKECVLIYLDVSLDELEKRLIIFNSRGIVSLNNSINLEEIFKEREKYYNKYSNITLQCKKLNVEDIVKVILSKFKQRFK